MTATAPGAEPLEAPAAAPAPEAPAAIQAVAAGKKYGRHVVIEDVSFSVHSGEVYALAGPNGSGKTTLIRLITGLSFPTSGKVYLSGQDVHLGGPRVRQHLGAVVEAPAAFYPHLTGRDNLRAHARLAGRTGWSPSGGFLIDDNRVREVLTLVELLRMADRPVREYSLGQRQRLGLAAAILGNPRVLILDEPTSGLDPLGIGLVHRVLSTMAAGGTAVVLSTHHLREVSSYAHRVGILGGGHLIDEVDLTSRHSAFRFRVDDPTRAAVALSMQAFVTRAYARPPYAVAHLEAEGRAPDALRVLTLENVKVYEAGPDHFDLHDYYRERVERI
ncbi:MAG TPA: ABC transporter ATP-binding protein [Deinococcales bacterium]|nr:ABC transporter ATP-binding protein [Deinococcales bacterium]